MDTSMAESVVILQQQQPQLNIMEDRKFQQIEDRLPNNKRKFEDDPALAPADDELEDEQSPIQQRRRTKATKRSLLLKKSKSAAAVARRRQRRLSATLLRYGAADAPFNSTSFIIDDHSDTVQYLDQSLGVGANANQPKRRRLTSFNSIGDDDESNTTHSCEGESDKASHQDSGCAFYTSPYTTDDEDYLNREFLKDYNRIRTDQLISMSKIDLINEYMQMESKIDFLEKRLSKIKEREESIKDQVDYDFEKGEIPMSPEVAEKIRIFQQEIHKLEIENSSLREKNFRLEEENGNKYSEDSSSDSSSSSSDDDDSDPEDPPPPPFVAQLLAKDSPSAVDTGYESNGNNNPQLRNLPLPPLPPPSPDMDENPTSDDDDDDNDDEDDHVPDFISDNAVSSTSP